MLVGDIMRTDVKTADGEELVPPTEWVAKYAR